MSWAEKIVSIGALAGIVTSLLGSLLGQARIYVTLGRQYLLPAWLVGVGVGLGMVVHDDFEGGKWLVHKWLAIGQGSGW
jgi:amino acid transporter